jgi:hypothetical protein
LKGKYLLKMLEWPIKDSAEVPAGKQDLQHLDAIQLFPPYSWGDVEDVQ